MACVEADLFPMYRDKAHLTVLCFFELVPNMRKPAPLKFLVPIAALIVVVVSLVSFAYFWPAKQTLKLSGQVQAREIRNGSRFGGRVKRVLVQEGQVVKTGQTLIEFDNTDLEAKIADARATLSQALAQEQLLAKGADLGAVRQAGASVQQAQERLKIDRKSVV